MTKTLSAYHFVLFYNIAHVARYLSLTTSRFYVYSFYVLSPAVQNKNAECADNKHTAIKGPVILVPH